MSIIRVMGDEDAPTGVAPTELAEPVVLDDVTAWSLDDGEDWPVQRSWRPVVLAVAGSVAAVGVAAGVAIGYLSGGDSTSAPATTPATTAVTTTVVTTTPATLKTDVPDAHPIETPTPTVTVPVVLTALDEQFLNTLTGKWGFNIANPTIAIQNAALVCKRLRSGIDLPQISQEMAAATEYDLRSAHIFASEVVLNYPSCHMP